jgi:hypothetical protein
MAERPGHRYVFVGGLQRSGTTLLARLLIQHDDIAGLVGTPTREDEGQFVQDVYLDDHKLGSADKGKRGQAVRWAYHPEAHLTEADLASRPDAAQRLEASWRPYWDKPTAEIYLEKSPSNLTRTRFLQAAFPSARFLAITRHPVMQALAVQKWTSLRTRTIGFPAMIDHWLTAMERYAADAPLLNHATTCRYEDLIHDPQQVLDRLQAFIGVGPAELDSSQVRDLDARYLDQWLAVAGRPGERTYQRRERAGVGERIPLSVERAVMRFIGKRSAKVIARRYDDRMQRFGYSMNDLIGDAA